jgi:uncharacterized glyoxalase superfamily protein PhnB
MAASLSCIEVVVADMATSLAFYRRLGLGIPPDADAQPHAEVALAGGLRVLFDTQDTIRSFDESWRPPTGGHGLALGFACESPADVDATFAGLVGAGAEPHLAPWDAFWGQRYAVVLDPDGNHVDLFAALPS